MDSKHPISCSGFFLSTLFVIVLFLGSSAIAFAQGAPTSGAGVGNSPEAALGPGIVVPFAGPPANIPPGWLLCDGSTIDGTVYAPLYAAIGEAHGDGGDGPGSMFNLPDYRGRFLRGVDQGQGRDPDSAGRTAMNTGGNTGDNVGSVQGAATGLPATDFTTGTAGDHTHTIQANGAHTHTIFGVGDHTHSISGEPSKTVGTTTVGNHSHATGPIVRPGNSNGDQNGTPRWGTSFSGGTTGSAGSHNHGVTIPSHTHTMSGEGAHTHTMQSNGKHDHTVDSAGDHMHSVTSGGDAETRPINAYVNWIIKI